MKVSTRICFKVYNYIEQKKDKENFEYLEIHYFDSLEGADSKIIELLNERVSDVKRRFDSYIKSMKDHYQLLEKQVAMYNQIDPNIIINMDHMSADSLIRKLTMVESKPKELWKIIEKHYGKDFFKGVAQYQYGINQADMNTLFEQQNEQLEEYKKKTLGKMTRICQESEEEIFRLRTELDERIQLHTQLEAKYFNDIKKVRKESKEQAEMQFKEFYDAKFHMFDIEKQEMYDQMRELKNKISEYGIKIDDSEEDEDMDKVLNQPDDMYSLDYKRSVSAEKMSMYKSMIQEKFEQLALDKAAAL